MSQKNIQKIILGSAILCMSLSIISCSNEEPSAFEKYSIEFSSPWTQKPSRVTGEINNDNLTDSKFKVWGWKANGINVFDGKEIVFQDGAWTYSPKEFWDTEANYDFVAIAPSDNATTATCSRSGIAINGIPQVQDASTGIDYLISDYIREINYKDASEGLQFTFHHILGKLQIWARCTFLDESFSSQVQSALINQLSLTFSEGNFMYTASYGENAEADYENKSWICTAESTGYTIRNLVSSSLEFNRDEYEKIGTPFFMAPTPEGIKVSTKLNLAYQLILSNNGGSFSFSLPETELPTLSEFHQGYVTNLYLNIRISRSNVGIISASIDPKIVDYTQDGDSKVDEQGILNF